MAAAAIVQIAEQFAACALYFDFQSAAMFTIIALIPSAGRHSPRRKATARQMTGCKHRLR
jgi:hypothetical protein